MRIAMKSLLVLEARLAAQGVSGRKMATTALLAAAAIAIATPPAAAQQLCGATGACWTVPDPVRTVCADGLGTNPQMLGCQWQITNPDEVMLSAHELPQFPPPDPALGLANGFFSASQYQSNCDGGPLFVNKPPTEIDGPLGGNDGTLPAVQFRTCSVVEAPVVDQTFLSQLQAAGLIFKIVYPIQDNGNGRGYVIWSNINEWNHTGDNHSTVAGYARITGATWQNQFQTVSFTTPAIMEFPAQTVTIPLGDNLGAGTMINAMVSPQRETTIRLAVPELDATIGTEINGFSYTVLTDSWLADTTPPVPPPSLTPPIASTQTPSAGAINIGSASTGAGSGIGTAGSGFAVNDAGFNWAAYCNSPDSLGRVRSPLWVQSCLAAELP
jgi:hypothetical protein